MKDSKYTRKSAPSFTVEVHMAGDIDAAALFIQQVAARRGMCVTIAPQSFIYSGGREEGFKIGWINYPRFPKEQAAILEEAITIAEWVRDHIGQRSCSIVTPTETIWISEEWVEGGK